MDEVDIVGHVDLLTKFNEDEFFIRFDNLDYLALAKECIDELIKANKIFEVNTGQLPVVIARVPIHIKRCWNIFIKRVERYC